jgi:lysophospholipase L1-like esterase
MKKLIIIVAAVLFALPSMAQGKSGNYYRLKTLYDILPVGSHNIVFLGDSITDGGEWAEIFENCNVLNRGISGDRAQWLGKRITPIVNGGPKKLFIMIGTNDLRVGNPIGDIIYDVSAIVDIFKEKSPNTEIYIQSVLPVDVTTKRYLETPNRNKEINDLNERYKKLCEKEGLTYIDLNTAMADENGNLRKDMSNDGLHLLPKGYMTWKNIILPFVE